MFRLQASKLGVMIAGKRAESPRLRDTALGLDVALPATQKHIMQV